MSPVLGVIASSNQQGRVGGVGSYDALATATVPSGGLLLITFAGIPAGYRHLQIRANIGKTAAGNNQIILLRFNGDATANKYKAHHLLGDGSVASGSDFNNSSPTNSAGVLSFRPDNSVNAFTGVVADILDYSSPSKNTTVRSFFGFDTNGTTNGAGQSGLVGLSSTLWIDTSPVNSISIEGFNGNVFPQFSSFALYGVK
jgi:hypothetical protein